MSKALLALAAALVVSGCDPYYYDYYGAPYPYHSHGYYGGYYGAPYGGPYGGYYDQYRHYHPYPPPPPPPVYYSDHH